MVDCLLLPGILAAQLAGVLKKLFTPAASFGVCFLADVPHRPVFNLVVEVWRWLQTQDRQQAEPLTAHEKPTKKRVGYPIFGRPFPHCRYMTFFCRCRHFSCASRSRGVRYLFMQ